MVVGADRTENKHSTKSSVILEFYFNPQEDNSKIEYVIAISDRYDSKVNNDEALKLIKELEPKIKDYFYKALPNDEKAKEYKKNITGKMGLYAESLPDTHGTLASSKEVKGELIDINVVGYSFYQEISLDKKNLNLKDYDADWVAVATVLIKYKSDSKTDSYENDEIKTMEQAIVFDRENNEWKYCGDNSNNAYTNILPSKDINWTTSNLGREISVDEEKQIQKDVNALYAEDGRINSKVKSFTPEKDGKLSVELLIVNKLKKRVGISEINFNLEFKDGYIIEVPLERDGENYIVDINENEGVYLKVILPTEKYGILDIKEVTVENYSYNWYPWEATIIK